MASPDAQKTALPPTPENLRDALRFWSTGVAVVAAAQDGVVHGMTINSFTSLSLDPPLVSISLEKVTRTHNLVMAAQAFAVTVLAAGQQDISDRFAGRDTDLSDRFAGLQTFSLGTGSPILAQGLAYFDCRVAACHDAGTHTVFLSDVLACGAFSPEGDQQPLIYFNRGYRGIKE